MWAFQAIGEDGRSLTVVRCQGGGLRDGVLRSILRPCVQVEYQRSKQDSLGGAWDCGNISRYLTTRGYLGLSPLPVTKKG